MSRGLVLVGGGLANCLIAWRLVRQDPDIDLVLLERGDTLGGDHTWSFHGADLAPEQHEWMASLVACSWPRREVRLPARRRRLDGSYHLVTAARLHAVVGEALGDRVRLGVDVSDLAHDRVRTRDGSVFEADAVLDGRGDPRSPHLAVRHRAFVAREVAIDRPHGMDGALIMDATMAEQGGCRLVRVLPLDRRRVLVEDSRDADPDAGAADALRRGIEDYAASRGWGIVSVDDEEAGERPILLGGDLAAFWRDNPLGVVRTGVRAALFHHATGARLPEAVRLADVLAHHGPAPGAVLDQLVRRHCLAVWRRYGFSRMLNRVTFLAGRPGDRLRVLERLHGLPERLIERFYAGRLGMTDYLRLVSGRPVPTLPALRAALETRRERMGPQPARHGR